MPPSSRELFISVDIEASGPIPGEYSMLSIGACAVHDPSVTFYVELVPLNENFTPEAMQTCDLSLAELRHRGTAPAAAMEQFGAWVREIAAGAWPVFCGFNAAFDWSFVNYYFVMFCGPKENPFGHTALDIKSYYMGAYATTWAGTGMRRLPPEIHSPTKPLSHNALDDAIQQADILARIMASQNTN
jgi:hypothetical protein